MEGITADFNSVTSVACRYDLVEYYTPVNEMQPDMIICRIPPEPPHDDHPNPPHPHP